MSDVAQPYGVVLFHTTSAALRAEKLLRSANVKVKLIPVPRELSSDCGISLRFVWAQVDEVKSVLADGHMDLAGVHRLSE